MPSDAAAGGTSEDGTRRSLPRGFFAMGTLSDLVVRQRDAPPREGLPRGRLHMMDFRGRTIPRPEDEERED